MLCRGVRFPFYSQIINQSVGNGGPNKMTIDLSKFFIATPMFSVRSAIDAETIEVNEYTMRNLQLQVALGVIPPFMYFTNIHRWGMCRLDGSLPTEPYSSGFVKDTNDFTSADSAMGLNDDLAIKLFRVRSATAPKFVPRSERKGGE